jgi:hypothetical protein
MLDKTKTAIYGSSDDLVEFTNDLYGEVGCYGTDDDEHGVLVICNDGTLLEVKYGKADMGIWGITVINQGTLFDRIEFCNDDDADPYSDIVYFKPGMKWAYAATEWQKVK